MLSLRKSLLQIILWPLQCMIIWYIWSSSYSIINDNSHDTLWIGRPYPVSWKSNTNWCFSLNSQVIWSEYWVLRQPSCDHPIDPMTTQLEPLLFISSMTSVCCPASSSSPRGGAHETLWTVVATSFNYYCYYFSVTEYNAQWGVLLEVVNHDGVPQDFYFFDGGTRNCTYQNWQLVFPRSDFNFKLLLSCARFGHFKHVQFMANPPSSSMRMHSAEPRKTS